MLCSARSNFDICSVASARLRGARCSAAAPHNRRCRPPARLWKLAEPEKTLNELRRMKAEDLSFEQVGPAPLPGAWLGKATKGLPAATTNLLRLPEAPACKKGCALWHDPSHTHPCLPPADGAVREAGQPVKHPGAERADGQVTAQPANVGRCPSFSVPSPAAFFLLPLPCFLFLPQTRHPHHCDPLTYVTALGNCARLTMGMQRMHEQQADRKQREQNRTKGQGAQNVSS